MAFAETVRLLASLELQDRFSGPARGIGRSMSGLERQSGSLGRISSQTTRGIGALGANVTRLGVIAGGALVGAVGLSINAASDLNEEIDKSAVVFGEAAERVQTFARGAASIGLATSEALGAAGAFGNMFRTTGLAQEESADMSVTMVQLAADMASFNNEDPSEMLDKLRSGLSGEAEPLRRFGVLLSEATVKEFAYRTGIARTGDALTEAQKVQARYGLILEQTAIQQGNYADTSTSVANQQRTLTANIKNTSAAIGTAFLPSLSKLSIKINELFIDKAPAIQRFAERLSDALAGVFTDRNLDRGMAAVGTFIDKLASGNIGNAFGGVGGVLSELGNLPWASIGDAARLLGTGSKALLDAFLGLPPWVQTAVLTGWGLNKLTGGALGGIIGELGKGLIKGVLGMNAGVVNINAATVNGAGGVPAAAGRGGIGGTVSTVARFVLGPVAAVLIGTEIAKAINDQLIAPTREEEEDRVTAVLEGGNVDDMVATLAHIESELSTGSPLAQIALGASHIPIIGDALGNVGPTLEGQRDALREQLAATGLTNEEIDRLIGVAQLQLEQTPSSAQLRDDLAAGAKAAIEPLDGSLTGVIAGIAPGVGLFINALSGQVANAGKATSASVDKATARQAPILADMGASLNRLHTITEEGGSTWLAMGSTLDRIHGSTENVVGAVTADRVDTGAALSALHIATEGVSASIGASGLATGAALDALHTSTEEVSATIGATGLATGSALDRLHTSTEGVSDDVIRSGSGIRGVLTESQRRAASDWERQRAQQGAGFRSLEAQEAQVNRNLGINTGAINASKERIAAQVARAEGAISARTIAVASAIGTNTNVLKSKNFAPRIGVTTNVTSNVTITDIQRKIVSSQIAQSVATGGGGFAV